MSNFKDTFTKNEGMDGLQYDDAASYTFFGSGILIIAIGLSWNIWSRYYQKPKFDRKRRPCDSKQYASMLDKAEKEFHSNKFTGFYYFKILMLILLIYLFTICMGKASMMRSYKVFDPYEILEVNPLSTDKQIKKAYKKMSLKFHPDRNPGDPEAKEKFILISKAKECLLDEDKKENCKKTGNPEGTQSFKVGFALPSSLLSKKNRGVVLSIFFLVILIILPTAVWLWYSENEKYTEDGISIDSIRNCASFMRNECLNFKTILEVFATSKEMVPLFQIRQGQGVPLGKLVKSLEKDIKPKANMNRALFLKPFYLIAAYLKRIPVDPVFEDDLRFIQRTIPKLLNSFEGLLVSILMSSRGNGGRVAFQSVQNMNSFAQTFFQGVFYLQSPFYQLPGMTQALQEKISRKFKKDRLKDLVKKQDPKKIEKLLSLYESDSDRKEAEMVFNALPRLQLDVEYFVEGEETISEEESPQKLRKINPHFFDFTTIKVRLTDLSIPEEQEEGRYMQSTQFLYPKYPSWNLYFTERQGDKDRIIDFKPVLGKKRVVEAEFKVHEKSLGLKHFRVIARSDCYIDFDEEVQFSYTVQKPIENNEYDLHEEDELALKQETLMQQIKNQLQEEDSDEELEDDESENEEIVEEGGEEEGDQLEKES